MLSAAIASGEARAAEKLEHADTVGVHPVVHRELDARLASASAGTGLHPGRGLLSLR